MTYIDDFKKVAPNSSCRMMIEISNHMKAFTLPLLEAVTPAAPAGAARSPQEMSKLSKPDADRANRLAAQALAALANARQLLVDLDKIVSTKDPAISDAVSGLLNATKLLAQQERGVKSVLPAVPQSQESAQEMGEPEQGATSPATQAGPTY